MFVGLVCCMSFPQGGHLVFAPSWVCQNTLLRKCMETVYERSKTLPCTRFSFSEKCGQTIEDKGSKVAYLFWEMTRGGVPDSPRVFSKNIFPIPLLCAGPTLV